MNHDPLQWLVTRVMPYGIYKGRLIADMPVGISQVRSRGLPARQDRSAVGEVAIYCSD
jgi:uncharacterized protein (DUF3820 family)